MGKTTRVQLSRGKDVLAEEVKSALVTTKTEAIRDGREVPEDADSFWRLSRQLAAEAIAEQVVTEPAVAVEEGFLLVANLQSFYHVEGVRSSLETLASGKVPNTPHEVQTAASKVLDTWRGSDPQEGAPPKTMEWFTGVVNGLSKKTVYVTLHDHVSRKYLAEIVRGPFDAAGVGQRDRFICLFTGNPDDPEVSVLKRPPRPADPELDKKIEALVSEVVDLLTAPEPPHAHIPPVKPAKARPRKARPKEGPKNGR